MPVVEVKNLFKKFEIPHERRNSVRENFVNIFRKNSCEIFNALEDVSFEINEGEFFGIIGRNGSGKSTLLKILAKVYSPTTGIVKVSGNISSFLELGIGFNPELSGRDNVFLGGCVLGMTFKEIEEKYDKIVEFAELERFMDQKVKNYSSGMYGRLAFSVAIQSDADVLILDEVLAVGDSVFATKCFEKFEEFKRSGKTVIFVSHDLSSVQKFCTRALYLKDGRVSFLGDTEEAIKVYARECLG